MPDFPTFPANRIARNIRMPLNPIAFLAAALIVLSGGLLTKITYNPIPAGLAALLAILVLISFKMCNSW